MSQVKPFTKRQIQIIIKIAFLEAMLIVFVLPSTQSTGEIASNACDGVFRSQYGRCEQILSPITVTIPISATSGSTSVSYPKPFTNVPFVILTQTSNVSIGIGNAYPITVPFLTTKIFPWAIPAALTEFGGNQSDELSFDPSAFLKVVITVTFDINTIPTAGSIIYGQISGDGGTTWVTLVSVPVDGTAPCTQSNGNVGIVCRNFTEVNPMITPPSITSLCSCYLLRIAGSGGDGTTVIHWSQIQLEFLTFPVAPLISCFYSQGITPRTSFSIMCTTSVANPFATTTIKFIWKSVSLNG